MRTNIRKRLGLALGLFLAAGCLVILMPAPRAEESPAPPPGAEPPRAADAETPAPAAGKEDAEPIAPRTEPAAEAGQKEAGQNKELKPSKEDEECLGCHSDKDLKPFTPKRPAGKLFVTRENLRGSVHEDLNCIDCHKAAPGPKAHYEGGPKPALGCGECHDKQLKDYNSVDVHGKNYWKKNSKAPWCHDCHGGHDIVPVKSKKSHISPLNIAELCGKCHANETLNNQSGITKRRLVERYYKSVHWQKVQEGKPAATCADCHGAHTIVPSSDRASSVTRQGMLNTCSKCHAQQVRTFSEGSHGRTLLHGNLDVPTCITCHGDHDIISLRMQISGKRDFAATQVCIWCHGNERMMARYALDTTPVESYMNDFHGLTQRGSSGTSATCADCHEAHHCLPSSHPESRMSLSNRGTTCSKCHGASTETFFMSFTHRKAGQEVRFRVTDWIKLVYIALIVLVVGGMLIHNFIIWYFHARRKVRQEREAGALLRLNRFERRWHWLLFLTFSALVLTGFALSFSEAVYVKWLYNLGVTEKMRGLLHRFAALLLMADMTGFLVYKTVTRTGRRWWTAMWPRWQDWRDFIATMRYYLSLGGPRPLYPVFNYAEKAEYWALWWGTLIMAATGVVLWISEGLPKNAPPWFIDAARAIHFYEAVLATLSILVWHFFHTIFHPDEYPVNASWITGYLTRHEAEEKFTPEAIQAQETPEAKPKE